MNKTNRFALMLEALTELAAEDNETRLPTSFDGARDAPAPAVPALRDVISSLAPLPREALFIGLAEDGLPVLLNLYDAVPGPLLVTGDQACGKTALLQMIARAIELIHAPSEVDYAIITDHPDDWRDFQANQNCAGIYSTQENAAQDFIYSLVSWAHNNRGEKQSVVLLIDNLESAIHLGHEAEQNLRWLLLRGPSRRVWPIVTLNAGRAENMRAWLGFFRTRLFGFIQNPQHTETVTGLGDVLMDDVVSGSQFSMREGTNWLNFWIPAID